ncbi:MAG: sugar phosphate isomerase/epimerase [Armatimonadota bacterium]|nr:sugar phosphate isomerase/epimerase [Armatimonadota bacterium]
MASKIAAQLYTVRHACQEAGEMAASLQKVADIGYEAVQLSGHGKDIQSEEIKQMCDDAGLTICATHTSYERMRDDLAGVVEEHQLYECTYPGIGGLPAEYRESGEGFAQFAREASEVAKRLAEHGLVFVYHNHSFELEKFGDRTGLQILLEESDPEYFMFEPDTYWLQHGGASPVAWLRRMGSRAPVVHFKDMAMSGREQLFAEIGEGNLDWEGIIAACEDAGSEWYIVEQDTCQRDAFESLKISFDNMRAMGIE